MKCIDLRRKKTRPVRHVLGRENCSAPLVMEEDRTVLGNAPNVKALVERNALYATVQASSDTEA